MLRLAFDEANARFSSRVVTGGAWGTSYSTWWTHTTPGDVTGATVGATSVLVTSKVVPLNPWDRPDKDDTEVTAIDLKTGKATAHLRIKPRIDSSVGLSDGSTIVAIEGGRLLRPGGSDG